MSEPRTDADIVSGLRASMPNSPTFVDGVERFLGAHPRRPRAVSSRPLGDEELRMLDRGHASAWVTRRAAAEIRKLRKSVKNLVEATPAAFNIIEADNARLREAIVAALDKGPTNDDWCIILRDALKEPAAEPTGEKWRTCNRGHQPVKWPGWGSCPLCVMVEVLRDQEPEPAGEGPDVEHP